MGFGAVSAEARPRRAPLPPRVEAPLNGTLRPDRPALPTDPMALPPLPDAYHQTLADGLGELGLMLDGAQLRALEAWTRLLLAWTGAINLTAIREPAAIAREHLLDSLSAVALLRGGAAEGILDLGSGAGLPGIPLAVAIPEARVLLVESVGKKAAFLRTAIAALGLDGRVTVAAVRAEALAAAGHQREAWGAVTIRAVAALPELVELAFPLLRPGGRLVAWKRGALDDELAAARRAIWTMGGGNLEVQATTVPELADHRLVVITKGGPTPRRFPRSPAERRGRRL